MLVSLNHTTATAMDPRPDIQALFQDKLCVYGFSEVDIRNLEVGIYNSILEYAGERHIPKSWKQPTFRSLYLYKAQSMFANLLRPETRERVLSKEFPINEMAKMHPDELAPDLWKGIIANEEARMKHAYEVKEVVMTDQITCGKCKNKQVSYYEKQTRSGDEGMTIFYKCIVCNNKWRQS